MRRHLCLPCLATLATLHIHSTARNFSSFPAIHSAIWLALVLLRANLWQTTCSSRLIVRHAPASSHRHSPAASYPIIGVRYAEV
jgi:hypothetical protein